MFNPGYALFLPAAGKQSTFHPNANSNTFGINPDHLQNFKFIGRVIGKAIFDGANIQSYFTRSLYKQMLGRKIS